MGWLMTVSPEVLAEVRCKKVRLLNHNEGIILHVISRGQALFCIFFRFFYSGKPRVCLIMWRKRSKVASRLCALVSIRNCALE